MGCLGLANPASSFGTSTIRAAERHVRNTRAEEIMYSGKNPLTNCDAQRAIEKGWATGRSYQIDSVTWKRSGSR